MSSKLEYSLGLSTTNFLGGIVGANQAVELFDKALSAVGSITEKVFGEIARGGALQDLSARTGESVGNLFKLQFAFEQSGVAAGNVGGVLLKFQKSLSGVGEMGENTAEAFKALGLSTAELASLDSPAALMKFFDAVNKLDRNSAADVVSRIFGRGAAGDILQLARDSKDFGENIKFSAEQAALFQRNAKAFDEFGDSIGKIKLQINGIFAGLAEEITPALNAIGPALEQGKIGELLEAELTYGFGASVNFFSKALQRMFAAIPGMWMAAVNGAAGLTTGALGGLVKGAGPGVLTAFSPLMPIGMGSALAALEKKNGAVSNFLLGSAGHFGGAFAGGINKAIMDAAGAHMVDILDVSGAKAKRDELRADIKKKDGKAEPPVAAALSGILQGLGTSSMIGSLGQANALQRMGLWNLGGRQWRHAYDSRRRSPDGPTPGRYPPRRYQPTPVDGPPKPVNHHEQSRHDP